MEIRLALHDDVPMLAGVERDAAVLFRQAGLDWLADGDPLDAGYLHMLVDQETLWVASCAGGETVGFLAAQPTDGLLHIVELSVASGYQRRGLGSLLIDQAIRYGHQHGFPWLTLTTYRHLAWNAPFYSKLGFIEAQASQLGPAHLTGWNNDALAGHASGTRCMMMKSVVPDRAWAIDQQNDGQLLHYQTYGQPDQPALVLVFGFGMSCHDWHELGYIEQLQQNFYLICPDLRGHGSSAKSCFSDDYRLTAMVADIERLMVYLDLQQPLLWGYSLGAKVVLATAAKCPLAYAGVVLGGFELQAHMMADGDLVLDTLQQGPAAWLALWQTMFDVPPGMAQRLAHCDTSALSALRRAEIAWPPAVSDPSTLHIPILLYAGEHCFFRDSTHALEEQFPASAYIELAGHNHFQLMTQSTWITQEVITLFADGVDYWALVGAAQATGGSE